MNEPLVDTIARAVLYEGYVLYPYRPSVKTRQRWTFGGVFPQAWAEAHRFGDSPVMQAQCLLRTPSAEPAARLSITLRFLHLLERTVEQAPDFQPVQSLRAGDREWQSWQEAVEREVRLDDLALADVLTGKRVQSFAFPATRQVEPIESAEPPARLVRTQRAIEGMLEVSAAPIGEGLVRLTIRVTNRTPLDIAATRDAALVHSFASTHLILTAHAADFISMTDPPAELAESAGQCQNIGCWPVLVGVAGQADTLLASPIILPDYPQIAPESPGDLFDGTEIDEILTLRIMTLTDEEKRQAAATDDRVAKLLARTEGLAREQLANLHGALRTPSPGGAPHTPAGIGAGGQRNPVDPLADRRELEKALAAGIELRPGDRVRLHPRKSADIFDIALAGRTATIAAIEQDLENRIHLAVTIDDDPGSDLGLAGKPGHRFFFSPEEVEVLP